MNKHISISIIIFLSPFLLGLNTIEDNRRIEEEKRESLQSSEIQLKAQKPDLKSIHGNTADLDYLTSLVEKRIATNEDGVRIMGILLNLNESPLTFEDQKQYLVENNFITKNKGKNFIAEEFLSKGLLAHMLLKAVKIKGGLILRLTGNSKRYALKELIYNGIMLPGSEFEYISGKELVETLIRALKYIQYSKGA